MSYDHETITESLFLSILEEAILWTTYSVSETFYISHLFLLHLMLSLCNIVIL